jgi:pimeloyl-ACP methyl ester carboxylesterase
VRAVLQLEVDGQVLTGTRHLPAGPPVPGATGVLFINFGYVPRDGHGGLAAHACDALAARGVPAYRFDLPRLGDTPGVLPVEAPEFYDLVTSGGYSAVSRGLVRALVRDQGLAGVVLGGLCGGAVTALYVGDLEPELVKGLILLEPELYLTEPPRTQESGPRPSRRAWLKGRLPPSPAFAPLRALLSLRAPFEPQLKEAYGKLVEREPFRKVHGAVFNYWGWMRLLTSEGQRGHWIPLPRKAILEFVLSRSELPAVTNLPLVSAWQHLVRAGRPVLVVTADGKLREVFFDSINLTVLKGLDTRSVRHVRLKHTNHLFTTGGAIQLVIGQVVPWVEALGGGAAPAPEAPAEAAAAGS